MSDRDELAAVIHKACGCDGACPPGTARRLEDSTIADAILARWRLVPVDSGATRPPSETYNGHRDWPQPVEGWNYVTEETLDTGLVTRVYTTRSGCEA